MRFFLLSIIALMLGCGDSMAQSNSPSPKRDINDVLRDHQDEIMRIPGVVGLYVGLLPNGTTPCLKVMLAKEIDRRAIPRELEGYPVTSEVTGEIRPLRTP